MTKEPNLDQHPAYVGMRSRGKWRDVDEPGQDDTKPVLRVLNSHPLLFYADPKRKEKKLPILTAQQEQAGLKYFKAYITWTGQKNLSMDLTQGGLLTKVQISGRSNPITEAQLEAGQVIKRTTQALGMVRAHRFSLMTGEGFMPGEVARKLDGHTSGWAAEKQRKYWFESLDIVAKVFGY